MGKYMSTWYIYMGRETLSSEALPFYISGIHSTCLMSAYFIAIYLAWRFIMDLFTRMVEMRISRVIYLHKRYITGLGGYQEYEKGVEALHREISACGGVPSK